MIIRQFFRISIIFFLAVIALAGHAGIQSVSEIKETAKTFLQEHFSADENRINLRIGKVDPRLRLTACDQALTAFVPQGTDLKGNAIIGIRCVGTKSWHIYVPVYIEIRQKVLKYSRSLPKGHEVGAKDIELTEVDISHIRSAPITDPKTVIGSILKRRVRAEEIVNPRSLCMVCKGDGLTIVSGNTRFQVTMEGVALEDGKHGERIKIQNAQSERVITGTVIAKQKVQVDI
ncbi:flagellar basal body P-ring formation chaperone FlgA [Pleionea sediminis]|uniref:flagellar basal body P-ring formation chaperone FlgA n=1 Tax=Pleionea sediminis TaxID=2569479 RepID=UPI001186C9CF|nr:flagellar basal body P-ring formation chaperone FlgA [Pleionea sediminis]